jgi:hypothetical protein
MAAMCAVLMLEAEGWRNEYMLCASPDLVRAERL